MLIDNENKTIISTMSFEVDILENDIRVVPRVNKKWGLLRE